MSEEKPPSASAVLPDGKFSYFNGAKRVYGNALRLMRNLYQSLGDPDDAFEASDKGDARAQYRPAARFLRAANAG